MSLGNFRSPGKIALIGALPLWAAACGTPARPPERIDPLDRSAASAQDITELEVQSLVMSMADDYGAALGEAMYLLVRSDSVDPKGRWLAQSFLRNGMGAAIDIAAGPNPSVGILDLLVLASLQSWSFEAHWIPSGIGEAAGGSAAARLRAAEAELWHSARRVLSADQQATLRGLIESWKAANPDRLVVSLVRFEDFTDQRRLPTLSARNSASGLLASVEKATAAVEDAKLLGERAIWFAGRLPYVLGQQVELTAYRMADQPEAELLRESLESVEGLVDSISERLRTLDADVSSQLSDLFSRLREERVATLDDLADRIAAAREAAIADAFERLALERKAFLDDVEGRTEAFGPLISELRGAIHATGELARDLTGTAEAIDRVLVRFDRDPAVEREPLDLTELTAAAMEASRAAERLTVLLDRTRDLLDSPDWETRLDRLEESTAGLVDRLFWRGLGIVGILLAGLAGLRFLPQRVGEKAPEAS